MAEIKNRSYNAFPGELVPSKGMNEIQDNIVQTSNELWFLINAIAEGSPEFATTLQSSAFNIDQVNQSKQISFEYNEDNMVTKITFGDNKYLTLLYDDESGVITGTQYGVISATLYIKKDSQWITKTISFDYTNGNVMNINIDTF